MQELLLMQLSGPKDLASRTVVSRLASTGHGKFVSLTVAAFIVAALTSTPLQAQNRRDRNSEKKEVQQVELKTREGLRLSAYYYPSDRGKDAIPVLLIHEWNGQYSPYAELAETLQSSGCAVLVPEYRGHGGSKEQINRRGDTVELDPATMRRTDVEAIIRADMEAAKAFLKDENNEGNLNLNALAVVGVREGSIIAFNWALLDWSFPSAGRRKQGQDVKALVLISPVKNIKGVAIDRALRDPRLMQLPIMIVAGEQSPEASEARRIGRQIENQKSRFSRGEPEGFVLSLPGTNLSAARLVQQSKGLAPFVAKFITNEINVSDDENPWIER